MKTALFGGTFDPIHSGHLAVAHAAQHTLDLDELLFVPTSQNPLKGNPPVASSKARMKMVELAIAPFADLGWRVVDTESRLTGPGFTIDTVEHWQGLLPNREWFVIVGSDSARMLPQWKSAPALAKLVCFAVVTRPGSPLSLPSLGKWVSIPMEPIAISSTALRDKLKTLNGQQWAGPAPPEIPLPVWEYLKEHPHLYASDSPSPESSA